MEVYLIRNTVNNKVYIGKTTRTANIRVKEHFNPKARHGLYFWRAIEKYGKDAFLWEILATIDDEQELNRLEVKYIQQYNSMNPKFGYNLRAGGIGGSLTDEAKARIGAASTGRKWTPSQREKLLNMLKTRTITDEWRANMSKAHRGQTPSNKGVPMTDETRAKVSAALKGRAPGNVRTISGLISPVGEVYSPVTNICAFAREHNLSPDGLNDIIARRYITHRGWRLYTPEVLEKLLFSTIQEPSSVKIKRKRGWHISAKTHCPKGHIYGGENLILQNGKERVCRICKNERNKASYHRKKTLIKG